jgi:hypothetical protein
VFGKKDSPAKPVQIIYISRYSEDVEYKRRGDEEQDDVGEEQRLAYSINRCYSLLAHC